MLNINKSSRIFFLQIRQCTIAALLVFASSLGHADDTEIYMGSGTSSAAETHPNVLFILDTSGSMNARDAGANRRTARMTVMKSAMADLLTTLDNVNIGLARFSSSGGSVIFPISPINGNANLVVGEATASQQLEFKAVLVNGSDDAEERVSGNSTGQVFLNDDVLEAFDFGGTTGQSGTETVEVAINSDDISEFNNNGRMLNTSYAYIHNVVSLGLRFQSVNIAQGATIQSAFLDFTHRIRRSNRTNAVISGLDIANTTTFSTSSRDLSSRATTSATVAWDGIPGGNRNTQFSTPDIATIVQEIVDRSDWLSGNAMGFKIFTSAGQRYPYARNSSSTRQPKLRIQMQAVAGAEGDDQLIALRFEDIRIPQGATIAEAKLLVTNSAAGGSSAVTWQIQAEQIDDSPALTSATNNLSSRKGGGTVVNWAVDGSTLNAAPSSCGTGCTDQLTKSTDNIASVLQEVTNRSGWCGGNALTILIDASNPSADQIRKLHSRDSAEAALAPKLVYKYTPQSGCMNSMEVAQVAASGDDAAQFSDGYSNRVLTIGDNLTLGTDADRGSQTVGLRFTAVDVPKAVTIRDAHIEFRAKGTSTGAASYTIQGIAADSIGLFASNENDISSKPKTTTSVTWAMSGTNAEDDWDTAGAEYQTEDLTSVVQEIVNRNGWSSKNNMGFIITGTGTRVAESFDGDPSKAPRLVISYDDSISVPFKAVREVLKEKVKELPARGGTPIAGSMYETAQYFRGGRMQHGKFRSSYGQISHPGTYCLGPGNCPGATPKSSSGSYYGGRPTDEFFVLNPSGCSKNNLGSSRCRNRKINGNPFYISPIKTDLECAANHQVLLTDGQAGGNDAARIKALIGKSTCHRNNATFKLAEHSTHSYISSGYYGGGLTAESCVPDLVEFLANEDQNPTLAGEQNVKTHTVAFALKSPGPVQFLKDVANLGGGGFYSADTAGDLQEVFQVILSDVRNAPTSFASPALATNAFNKLLSRNDVYFGLFTPQLSQAWHGNVKRYKVCVEAGCGPLGGILDETGNSAIDSQTQRFTENAKSFWSGSADGPATTKGGAGGEIDHTTVTLLTDRNSAGLIAADVSMDETGFKLTNGNWDSTELGTIRSAICKNPSASSGTECEKRMRWLLGKKVTTDAENDVDSDTRWAVNDVLHSSPVVITYGGSTSGQTPTFIDKVVYGTNAGTLHMINGATGKEEWRYLPSDFWSMQRQLFDNRQDVHTYGMDATPTLWQCDVDGDGIIEPGGRDISLGDTGCGIGSTTEDFVRIITATRRGGGGNGFIYALDLSASMTTDADRVFPKFMWRIAGGTGDFTRLAQTWSQPKLTTIMVRTDGAPYPKDVLIFGGGYDIKLDEVTKYTPADNNGNDYLGNAIYIVDPMDGTKILSISGTGSGADIQVPKMQYSIPSRIEFLDSDTDGITDRLYVGDTGGQLWRVDLAEELQSGNPAGTVVGLLAAVSDPGAAGKRRFFEPPSVVQVSDGSFSTAEQYDYVLIGSGYRSHPLDQSVHDRFYAFRDRLIGNNALLDVDNNHIAEGYPTSAGTPYNSGTLVDVTTTTLAAIDASGGSDTVSNADGWYFDFTTANGGVAGEKVLSSPLTIAGTVAFTTFNPTSGTATATQAQSNNPCSASAEIGQAIAYNFDILSTEAPLDFGGGATINTRRRVKIGSGIPSDVVPVFTREGVVGIVGVEGGSKTLGTLTDLPQERVYWYED